MNRKILSLQTLLMLAMLVFPMVSAVELPQVPNPDKFTCLTVSGPATADPSRAYDMVSAELILNVYQCLCDFEFVYTDRFVAEVSESWPGYGVNPGNVITPSPPDPTYAGPLDINQTWYFKIRKGIPWQDPMQGNVTTFDVEYSFERGMVEDPEGGPMWLFYKPLTGRTSSRDWDLTDPAQVAELGLIIDEAIKSNATHMWFNLVEPHEPYLCFQQTLCRSWGSIICAAWAIGLNCWNASWHITPGNYISWVVYNNPPEPGPIGFKAMGQGPYIIFQIEPDGSKYVLNKFKDYWGGWTKPHCSTIVHEAIEDWLTRKTRFLSDDPAIQADKIAVIGYEEENDPDLLAAIADGRVRYMDKLPMLGANAIFYCYNFTDPASPYMHYIGDGMGGWKPNATLLSDIDMRLALTHCFNTTEFIEKAYLGKANELHNPIIYGVSYCNATKHEQLRYQKSIDLATQHFQHAWGGEIWGKGFKMYIVYPQGSPEQVAAQMIEYVVEKEITWPKSATVDVIPLSLPWPIFLVEWVSGRLGCYTFGEGFSDFPDPHFCVMAFMHTQKGLQQHIQYGRQPMNWHPQGSYGQTGLPYRNYEGQVVTEINNTYVDGLIEKAANIANPIERERCYNELMDIYYAECANCMTVQPHEVRHYERSWVHGWFHHVCIHPRLLFYGEMNLWKEDPATVTRDVDAIVHLGQGPPTSAIPYVEGNGKRILKLINLGENPELVEYHEAIYIESITDPVLYRTRTINKWLRPGDLIHAGEEYVEVMNIYGHGMGTSIAMSASVSISRNWVLPIGPIKLVVPLKWLCGDLGRGVPPQFFAFDGIVDGKDLALFLQCYRGLAPFNAIILADIGGGIPPSFWNFDGKVDGKDLALFLLCYRGLGPDP